MESIYTFLLSVSFTIFLLFQAWKFLNWSWFNPRRDEKRLRQMGFNGNPYKFFSGDFKEMSAVAIQALSKPIPLTNDIVPRVIPFIQHMVNKYGNNSFMWFGPVPGAIISDPEIIKEILSKNFAFHKINVPYGKLLAQGVAAAEDDKWVKLRTLINPAFHMDKLKGMLPSFKECCLDMMRKWEEMVSVDGSAELDVWPHLQTLSSDAISRTAFGSNYAEGRKVFELQKELGALIINAIRSLYIPGWRFLPTKANRRMWEIKKEVESCIMGIINKRMRAIETGEATYNDLLGILLESNYKAIKQNGEGSGISLRDVMEECKLFYIAGQETTSSLVVWTLILLAQHHDWQERARAEVLHVVGSNDDIDFHQLNQLKAMNMILYEVMRLYTTAPMLNRIVHEETPVKNLTLPAGMLLLLPAILLHQDPNTWGENAKEFDPERFKDGIYNATKGKLAYFPFGSGPRTCVGQNFAMLEAKMTLAMILQRFSFEISPSYAHAPEVVLVLQPQFGVQLVLRRIPAGN